MGDYKNINSKWEMWVALLAREKRNKLTWKERSLGGFLTRENQMGHSTIEKEKRDEVKSSSQSDAFQSFF